MEVERSARTTVSKSLDVHRRKTCSNCKSSSLELAIDLGDMPLANALLPKGAPNTPEPTYPLNLYLCTNCALLQVGVYIDPAKIFTEYPYFSSFSDSMLQHVSQLTDELSGRYNLNADSLVVELASNDGYLLQYFDKKGIPVVGVEPARNVAKVAQSKGIETICAFFGKSLAQQIRTDKGSADLVLSLNVFAHVPEISDFVEGVKTILDEDGVWIIETPYVGSLVEDLKFDTIYHEHNYCYSLSAICNIVEAHNLVVTDIETVPIHGGSIRVSVMHQSTGSAIVTDRVTEMRDRERENGMLKTAYYSGLMTEVDKLGAEVVDKLKHLKNSGYRIAGYGAGAKGAIFLNYFNIGSDLLEFVVDRNTYKQGHYMPGVRLSIQPPDALTEEKIDYCLILTWNFLDEVVDQLTLFSKGGGKFIVAIPRLKVFNQPDDAVCSN